MFSESEWRLVGDALKVGRYNLLLGAGVSLDSGSGLSGQNCLSASGLTAALQKELPGVRKGSGLNRLYRAMTPEQVDMQITRRFANCIPGATVNAIAGFRWKRIFTLNVDDALERAYETQALPIQISQPLNYNSEYRDVRDLRVLPIVHLHGFARQPGDGYVFELAEYARSMSNNNIWANILAQLIRTEPFIVLGTSLEEPDLSFFLSQRDKVRPRGDSPPSVIVEPDPDDATAKDCEAFRMTLFEGKALDFLSEINARFPSRPSVQDAIEENLGEISKLPVDPLALAEFSADFERVSTEALVGTDSGANFAYGHQATWLDLQNGRDLPRCETAALQDRILRIDAASVSIVEGGPGAGKSTVLRRIAWSFGQGGHTCFWLRSIGRMRTASAATVLGAMPRRQYVFVDNFADHALDVTTLRERLRDLEIVFVGAERSYRLDHVERLLGNNVARLVTLGAIGLNLSQGLVHVYTDYGLARPRTADTIRFSLEKELIAIACCRVLNNFEPLGTIIDKSVSQAPKDVDCYIFAALAAHCNRQGVEHDVISGRFPDYQVDLQIERDGPLPLKLEAVLGTEFVTPLNEAVSDAVLGRFAAQQPERMLAIFINLALAIRPRVSVGAIRRGEPCARIASRLFDYDEVGKKFLGVRGAAAFFDATKREWDWNSRYWQQRAQLELDLAAKSGDAGARQRHADVAVQHARFAETIEPRHQFTMTTIGRTIFGRMRVLGEVSAADLADAISVLGRAMSIERDIGRVTVHPYMILFKGLSEAFGLGGALSPDQRSVVLSHIDRVRNLFPRDREIVAEGHRLQLLVTSAQTV